MALPWYPTTLPAPLRQGAQLARGDGRVPGREDAGPRSTRRRFSAVVDTFSMTTVLYRHELATFDRFYNEDIVKGALPFLMPDPFTDGWPLLTDEGIPLLTDEGVPLLMAETWLCMMGNRLPAISDDDLRFRVTFDIAVLP